ncbi:TXNDC9 protein [Aphelenchoides besseyi]|nr:TXNDC9 protein [Aphelenchoides besseyi]
MFAMETELLKQTFANFNVVVTFEMEAQLANQILKAATIVEQKVDEELNKLDNLDDDGLEEIRRKRLLEMQKIQEKKQHLQTIGHGKLSELSGDKDFIEAGKESPKLVCYFYAQNTEKSQAVEKCLENLASANFFYSFCPNQRGTCELTKKCPFLIERLRLKSIPVIAIVRNEKIVDYIRLADKLEKNVNELERLIEQKLFEAGAIEKVRSNVQAKTTATVKRSIRGHESDDSDFDY